MGVKLTKDTGMFKLYIYCSINLISRISNANVFFANRPQVNERNNFKSTSVWANRLVRETTDVSFVRIGVVAADITNPTPTLSDI